MQLGAGPASGARAPRGSRARAMRRQVGPTGSVAPWGKPTTYGPASREDGVAPPPTIRVGGGADARHGGARGCVPPRERAAPAATRAVPCDRARTGGRACAPFLRRRPAVYPRTCTRKGRAFQGGLVTRCLVGRPPGSSSATQGVRAGAPRGPSAVAGRRTTARLSRRPTLKGHLGSGRARLTASVPLLSGACKAITTRTGAATRGLRCSGRARPTNPS